METIPSFRYHPDPLATGSVAPSDQICVVCGAARGFIYVGPVYAVEEYVEEICPWCIASGEAARQLEAEFTDVGVGVPADVDESVTDEVAQRTPGFAGWQQEHWLYHCADAAAFLGRAGYEDVRSLPDALEMLRGEGAEGGGGSDEETDHYLRALAPDGDVTAYLFRCLHCGRHLAYSDCS